MYLWLRNTIIWLVLQCTWISLVYCTSLIHLHTIYAPLMHLYTTYAFRYHLCICLLYMFHLGFCIPFMHLCFICAFVCQVCICLLLAFTMTILKSPEILKLRTFRVVVHHLQYFSIIWKFYTDKNVKNIRKWGNDRIQITIEITIRFNKSTPVKH
jgi:hypothetical protein